MKALAEQIGDIDGVNIYGRVVGVRGLMVEMRATNVKLHGRAVRMVATLAGVDETSAASAFAETGGSIKLATLMLARGLDLAEAETRLAAAGGNLRLAMQP